MQTWRLQTCACEIVCDQVPVAPDAPDGLVYLGFDARCEMHEQRGASAAGVAAETLRLTRGTAALAEAYPASVVQTGFQGGFLIFLVDGAAIPWGTVDDLIARRETAAAETAGTDG